MSDDPRVSILRQELQEEIHILGPSPRPHAPVRSLFQDQIEVEIAEAEAELGLAESLLNGRLRLLSRGIVGRFYRRKITYQNGEVTGYLNPRDTETIIKNGLPPFFTMWIAFCCLFAVFLILYSALSPTPFMSQ